MTGAEAKARAQQVLKKDRTNVEAQLLLAGAVVGLLLARRR